MIPAITRALALLALMGVNCSANAAPMLPNDLPLAYYFYIVKLTALGYATVSPFVEQENQFTAQQTTPRPVTSGPGTVSGSVSAPYGSIANAASVNGSLNIIITSAPSLSESASFATAAGTGTVCDTCQSVSSFVNLEAEIVYTMEIKGPPGTVSVFEQSAAGGTFSGNATPLLGAELVVAQPIVQNGVIIGYGNIITKENGPFSIAQDFAFQTNTLYAVAMDLDLVSGVSTPFGSTSAVTGSASAFFDPTFTLDVSDPQAYSLEFSPNLSSTPLPASWTMMLLGLAGLGFTGFLRQKKTSQMREQDLNTPTVTA